MMWLQVLLDICVWYTQISDSQLLSLLIPNPIFIPSSAGNIISCEDDLINVFESLGPLKNVSIAQKDGKSKGFAFVKFAFAEDAEKAMETLQGTTVKGR